MRRFASGVTSESHQLYGPFMRQLSACIFEWDAGDVCRLLEAKRSELEGKHGMVGLTEAEVSRKIGRKEIAVGVVRVEPRRPKSFSSRPSTARRGSTPWASRCWTPSASRRSGKSRGATSTAYRTHPVYSCTPRPAKSPRAA